MKTQRKMEKLIYKLKFFDVEKAKNSLKYEINNTLKELIYKILVGIKNNDEIEQIFVDYYTYYSENKEDPVLEIISSYWEA